MTLVVDASVAIKLLVREEGTERARDLLRTPDAFVAPDWLLVEAASSFWKKVRKSELLSIHAERHLEALPHFFERLYPSADLVPAALALALRLRQTVYDCLYLALAIRDDLILVTADERLVAGVAAFPEAARVRSL